MSSNPFHNMNQIARHETGPRDAYLAALGARVRALRHRRGMTRKRLAEAAGVSERHLANLETGQGNASVMLLRDLARALGSSIAEIVGEESAGTGERARILELLRGRDETALVRARRALAEALGTSPADARREGRIALTGLRGAGKSTLGRMLAEDLRVPFVELDRVVERTAGCGVAEIHSLYGAAAFRRYELRALEDTIAEHDRAVIATGGGLVTEAATYDLLLARCFTVWLRASPDDHMKRVMAQGDLRPMAGNAEAMADLKRILAAREEQYARADLAFDTSAQPLAEVYLDLRNAIGARLPLAA
jgi:XRE family aerobic/anaerobic benzoate catabolism transcriptional regulator